MPDLSLELHPALVGCLACPVCGAPLSVSENKQSLACAGSVGEKNPRGRVHLFDGSSDGYVHLAPRHSGGGDSKEAVRARSSFLGNGYYAPAAEALTSLVRELTPDGGLVLDAGCGEGYYSGQIAAAGYPTLGVDLSKFAVGAAAKAARAHRLRSGQASSTLFAVGSVFELPVADASFDTLVNVFAPCAPEEYARVLRPGGHLIVAGAGERHLLGLKRMVYDDPYLNDPRRDLPDGTGHLRPADLRNVTFSIRVEGKGFIEALFSMTPYYWRTARSGHERLAAAEVLETEVSFNLHVYERV